MTFAPSVCFSMIANPVVADEALDRIVRAIVDRVHPARIVLYGSRARGDARPTSDYDLYIEVDHGDGWPGYWQRVGEIHDAIDSLEIPVDVIVRKPGSLEAQRDDPGRTEWDVAREGIIVYPLDADSSGLRPPRHPAEVREGRRKPPASVKDWIERADEDVQAIEIVVASSRVPWSVVAFHSQQAAEKYLKTLFISQNIRPPRTHDLATLVKRCRRSGYALPDLSTECAVLKPYAVKGRYPEEIPIPNETDGRAALEAGRRVVAAARTALATRR